MHQLILGVEIFFLDELLRHTDLFFVIVDLPANLTVGTGSLETRIHDRQLFGLFRHHLEDAVSICGIEEVVLVVEGRLVLVAGVVVVLEFRRCSRSNGSQRSRWRLGRTAASSAKERKRRRTIVWKLKYIQYGCGCWLLTDSFARTC